MGDDNRQGHRHLKDARPGRGELVCLFPKSPDLDLWTKSWERFLELSPLLDEMPREYALVKEQYDAATDVERRQPGGPFEQLTETGDRHGAIYAEISSLRDIIEQQLSLRYAQTAAPPVVMRFKSFTHLKMSGKTENYFDITDFHVFPYREPLLGNVLGVPVYRQVGGAARRKQWTLIESLKGVICSQSDKGLSSKVEKSTGNYGWEQQWYVGKKAIINRFRKHPFFSCYVPLLERVAEIDEVPPKAEERHDIHKQPPNFGAMRDCPYKIVEE